MKNFIPRAISGIIYALIIFLGSTIHPYGLIALMAIFASLSLYEFIKMTHLKDKLYLVGSIVASAILFILFGKEFLTIFLNGKDHFEFFLNSKAFIPPVLFIISIITIFFSTRELLNDFSKATIAVVYVIMPFVLAFTLPTFSYELGEYKMFKELLFIFILLWTSDSFAYIAGNLFGKHKFAPKISGAKTWEGFAGGLIFTILAGFIIEKYFDSNAIVDWSIIGIIVALLGPIGDLTESKLKRFFQIKDSGTLIPGHGGFLDRLDSFIFVVPFIYLYYLLVYTL
ncbi:phosphatidate cytidylyltransferase [Faecalibacter rhinopitheci]|uniref:Phosphatidate cytidylyltransferase n=1 Tax=Faecalibacter rhinopitheci TaxID=2779678 RepID=A0A8J7FNY4_9FLAO|nr:phosphatidate cytidylyltransferase [Faecalibacter rhinopitheci]MBF0596604.1 phosphatidate cytidylyltransferase [Faecalibacter rhinopitheci]